MSSVIETRRSRQILTKCNLYTQVHKEEIKTKEREMLDQSILCATIFLPIEGHCLRQLQKKQQRCGCQKKKDRSCLFKSSANKLSIKKMNFKWKP